MELKKLVAACYDAIAEDIKESVKANLDNAIASVNTKDGYIDIYSIRNKHTRAYVYHDNDEDRDGISTNLDAFLSERLDMEVDWSRLEEQVEEEREDMWNSHGFADESDYINYRYR